MAGRLIDSAGVTVFEGTAVGIGGSQPVKQETAEGATQVSIAAGDSALLTWEYVDSDHLLDYTVPTAPTFIAAGTYAVTATAACADSPSVGWYELQITVGSVGPFQSFTLEDPGWSQITAVSKVPAGDPLGASVVNHHATDALHFALGTVWIVKLA